MEVFFMNQNKEVVTETIKEPQENFTTEIFRTLKAQSKAVIIGLIILLAVSSAIWTVAYYQNDKKWRELFSEYDYISQDGEGFNNINSGTQGSLDNSSDVE